MPLKKGYSRKSILANIRSDMERGISKKQAIAIALETARVAAKKAGKPGKSAAKKKGKK